MSTAIFHPSLADAAHMQHSYYLLDCLSPCQWSPHMDISQVCSGLYELLRDPASAANADMPMNPGIAQLLRSDRAEFDRQARECTLKHAI
jgi:ubiquitin-protein ligase